MSRLIVTNVETQNIKFDSDTTAFTINSSGAVASGSHGLGGVGIGQTWQDVTSSRAFKTELEEMIPWEREIYIGLLMQYLKEEKERIERENRRNG